MPGADRPTGEDDGTGNDHDRENLGAERARGPPVKQPQRQHENEEGKRR